MCNCKCMSQAKSLVKFVQKQLEIPFFQFVVCDQVKNRKTLFLCSGDIQQKPNSNIWVYRETQFPPLLWHPDLPIRKSLRSVLSLLTVLIILKGVSEIFFFQNSKFIAFKVKTEREVGNSLMAFNLLNIIHPL